MLTWPRLTRDISVLRTIKKHYVSIAASGERMIKRSLDITKRDGDEVTQVKGFGLARKAKGSKDEFSLDLMEAEASSQARIPTEKFCEAQNQQKVAYCPSIEVSMRVGLATY